jgi:tetratricopeptide (TPR) repeat protein
MFREARLALLLAAMVLLAGGVVHADELTEFEKGRNSFSGGRYEEAVERFAQMLDASHAEALESPQLIEQARIYRAASLIALGRLSEADQEIETILRANPGAYPDPVIFPGVVLDRFTDVRGRIRQELEDRAREKARQERLRLEREQARQQRERDRVLKLEQLAQQELHVVRNSRWVAAIPFGVGQFQNQQPVTGWSLLLGEAALATTSVVTAAIALDLQSRGTEPNVDKADLNSRISTMKTVNHLSFAAFAIVAAGGVVHAQLTFEPYRKEVRKRELPEDLKATPTVTSVQGGAVFGLGGTF